MASYATLGFDRRMLENKGTGLLHVAFEANRILRGGVAQLLGEEAAMLVVAVGAFDQTFLHPVMERPVKIGLDLEVAGKAKVSLGFGQQELPLFRLVHRMTIN